MSTADRRHLSTSQLLPAKLTWTQENCVVSLRATQPGETDADSALTANLTVDTLADASPCSLRVAIRIPAWAYAAQADAGSADAGSVAVAPNPQPGSLLRRSLVGGEALRLRLWARTTLKRADGEHGSGREAPAAPTGAAPASATATTPAPTRVLSGLMHGPLLLAALTDGERLIRAPSGWAPIFDPRLPLRVPPKGAAARRASAAAVAWTTPVPAAARRELASLEWIDTSRWSWWCGGGGGGSGSGSAALANQFLMTHAGEGQAVRLSPRPEAPPAIAPRVGGSDAVHAATWRLTTAPVGHGGAHSASSPSAGTTAADGPLDVARLVALADQAHAPVSVVFEAFDRPGMVLTLAPRVARREGERSLRLQAARPAGADAAQRWWLRRAVLERACAQGGDAARQPAISSEVSLESAAEAGVWVQPAAASGLAASAGTATSAARFRVAAPLALYPPLAFWAHSNVSCPTYERASTSSCRQHYLMVPLRDVIDESYSAHLCVIPSDATRAPTFCHR